MLKRRREQLPARPNSSRMRMVQCFQHPGLEPLGLSVLMDLHLLEEKEVRHAFALKPLEGAPSGFVPAWEVNQHGIGMPDRRRRSCVG